MPLNLNTKPMRSSVILKLLIIIFIVAFNLNGIKSQTKVLPYVNAGFVTNLKKEPENLKADLGGSLRIGVLNKGLFGNGRFGFYGGFLWFQEYHPQGSEYNDQGRVFFGGLSFMLLTKEDFSIYTNLGIGIERFISLYSNSTKEVETSGKPDFGVLFNYKLLNVYLGWQPSAPSHINIGIGLTIAEKAVLSGY